MKGSRRAKVGQGVLVGVLACLVVALVSPLRVVWATADAPWWTLTVLWAAVVAATALVAQLWSDDSG